MQKKCVVQWTGGLCLIVVELHIWFLPLICYLVKLGFQFHHARPEHVMMTKWLPTTEPNNLPNFANHYIGQWYIALVLK